MPISITNYEDKMSKTIESLNADLNTIRAGRANPRVLDRITIDYFGVQTPLNQVGNITVPEARLLQIAPWDKASLKLIEKAIQASDIGINPTNDGNVIRLAFPELTEDRRKALSKEAKKKGDDFKIAIRNIRRDGMEDLKKQEKKSEITEDELKSLEDKLQKATDKFVTQIDKIIEEKSKEIMSI